MYMYVCVCMYMCTCICVYVCLLCVYVYVYVCMCICGCFTLGGGFGASRHLYVATMDGKVASLDQDGYVLWQYNMPHSLFSSTLTHEVTPFVLGSMEYVCVLKNVALREKGRETKECYYHLLNFLFPPHPQSNRESPHLIPGLDGELYQWDGVGMKVANTTFGNYTIILASCILVP